VTKTKGMSPSEIETFERGKKLDRMFAGVLREAQGKPTFSRLIFEAEGKSFEVIVCNDTRIANLFEEIANGK